MNQEILDYLQQNRICVLAVEMMNGSPHAATVHYAHSENPLMFFFETNRDYRKSEPLFGRETTRASMVIGFSESEGKTFQMDGEVRLLKEDEKIKYEETYLGKFPEKTNKISDVTKMVRFTFVPTWWRYTDFTKPKDQRILVSTEA